MRVAHREIEGQGVSLHGKGHQPLPACTEQLEHRKQRALPGCGNALEQSLDANRTLRLGQHTLVLYEASSPASRAHELNSPAAAPDNRSTPRCRASRGRHRTAHRLVEVARGQGFLHKESRLDRLQPEASATITPATPCRRWSLERDRRFPYGCIATDRRLQWRVKTTPQTRRTSRPDAGSCRAHPRRSCPRRWRTSRPASQGETSRAERTFQNVGDQHPGLAGQYACSASNACIRRVPNPSDQSAAANATRMPRAVNQLTRSCIAYTTGSSLIVPRLASIVMRPSQQSSNRQISQRNSGRE